MNKWMHDYCKLNGGFTNVTTQVIKTHALNKLKLFVFLNFMYLTCRTKLASITIALSLLFFHFTYFILSFHTLRSKCLSKHIFHIPTYNSKPISESYLMTHGFRLQDRFMMAWLCRLIFPTITGNQPGGVHRGACCHCFSWLRAQHNICTCPGFFSRSFRNVTSWKKLPVFCWLFSSEHSLSTTCNRNEGFNFLGLISKFFCQFVI